MSLAFIKGLSPTGELVSLRLNSDGSLPTSAQSLYALVQNAPDMTKTISYADVGDINNERITSILISSASIGASFTDTYSYAGSAGKYRITGIVRTQS